MYKNKESNTILRTDDTMSNPRPSDCVPLYSEVNLADMIVSKPIASTTTGRGPTSFNMFVGAPGRQPFRFQMSRAGLQYRNTLVFPPDTPVNGGSRVNLALSVPKGDTDVFEFWSKVDSIIIEHVAKHSKEFLKRLMTEEDVRAIYTPTLRSKDDYDSYVKARFDISPDARCPVQMFDVNEYNKRYASMHHSRLEQGDAVTTIGQLGMVYFFNQKVGLTVDISHLTRYAPPPANDFPFQLEGEYSRCLTENLFTEIATVAEQLPIEKAVASSMELVEMKTEAASAAAAEAEDEAASSSSTAAADGSTVKIDPVTMLPLAPEVPVEVAAEERPSKRRR